MALILTRSTLGLQTFQSMTLALRRRVLIISPFSWSLRTCYLANQSPSLRPPRTGT
jgi:hypothetical protein